MIEEAERRAGEEGIENVSFALGDATALEFADDSFDGAIMRLSLHHIPAPGRVVAEMTRLVRPGGWVLVSDIVADPDRDANAWARRSSGCAIPRIGPATRRRARGRWVRQRASSSTRRS